MGATKGADGRMHTSYLTMSERDPLLLNDIVCITVINLSSGLLAYLISYYHLLTSVFSLILFEFFKKLFHIIFIDDISEPLILAKQTYFSLYIVSNSSYKIYY